MQFLAGLDALSLDESLDAGDVSRAWLVWSSAAETALADAYQFAGGPVPDRGLITGKGTARMRVVRLGGPEVRKARRNAADAHEGGDVFLYRDSSDAPLLDLRRGTKAVMDVLDAMIRDGISLARSVELTALSGMRFFGWAQSILFLGKIWSWLGVVVLVSVGVLWEIFTVGFLVSSTG